MPQFVAQILSLDGDVILSNVDVSIDFSPQGMAWRGNFDLPPTSTFDPNSLPQRKMYKIQLNDGRTGEMLTFPLCCFDQISCWLPRNTP
jgi:hypothetical protein